MISNKYKRVALIAFAIFALNLTACSNSTPIKAEKTSKIFKQSRENKAAQQSTISRLDNYKQTWKGTRYRLGGTTRKGVDCSAFMQNTFRDLFGISLPRTTSEQAKQGTRVSKSELKTGDLVFFKTGRGPNGKHVGVYVNNGQFMHASTKGGVIYSSLNSPYWSRTFWQARRL